METSTCKRSLWDYKRTSCVPAQGEMWTFSKQTQTVEKNVLIERIISWILQELNSCLNGYWFCSANSCRSVSQTNCPVLYQYNNSQCKQQRADENLAQSAGKRAVSQLKSYLNGLGRFSPRRKKPLWTEAECLDRCKTYRDKPVIGGQPVINNSTSTIFTYSTARQWHV